LLRDNAAFASGKGGFGFIDGNENFRAGALTFFPQGKGFVHRIFFAVKPSALNSLTDKGLLVRGELYFHQFQGTEKLRFRQAPKLDPFGCVGFASRGCNSECQAKPSLRPLRPLSHTSFLGNFAASYRILWSVAHGKGVQSMNKTKKPRLDTLLHKLFRGSRISLGLSQSALAKCAGVSKEKLSRWEKGRAKISGKESERHCTLDLGFFCIL
jgi:DNA-binding XRE family transcriptional regulator